MTARRARISATSATSAQVPSSTTNGTNPISAEAEHDSDAPITFSAWYGADRLDSVPKLVSANANNNNATPSDPMASAPVTVGSR